jgi:hypothetical protein
VGRLERVEHGPPHQLDDRPPRAASPGAGATRSRAAGAPTSAHPATSTKGASGSASGTGAGRQLGVPSPSSRRTRRRPRSGCEAVEERRRAARGEQPPQRRRFLDLAHWNNTTSTPVACAGPASSVAGDVGRDQDQVGRIAAVPARERGRGARHVLDGVPRVAQRGAHALGVAAVLRVGVGWVDEHDLGLGHGVAQHHRHLLHERAHVHRFREVPRHAQARAPLLVLHDAQDHDRHATPSPGRS